MKQRRWEELEGEWRPIRRGWCFGKKAFREEWLAQMSVRMGGHHYGMERREGAEEQAERVVREELRKAGRRPEELAKRSQGGLSQTDRGIALEARDHDDTQVDQSAFSTGAWTHLNKQLYEDMRRKRSRVV